ncbi:unnamed protein product [marine sediment metagenome]|uniref:Uncharacterized protein n=1 Tax=marine sediment metagenome TaxID=412755 RepID=X1HV36_9ZZZZ
MEEKQVSCIRDNDEKFKSEKLQTSFAKSSSNYIMYHIGI